MKKRQLKKLVWSGIILCCLLAGLIIWTFFVKYETQKIPIFIRVGDYVGFNITQEKVINFGTVMPGGNSERSIVLTGERAEEITLHVENIDFIVLSEERLILQKDEKRIINLLAAVPQGLPKGTYEGELLVTSKRI